MELQCIECFGPTLKSCLIVLILNLCLCHSLSLSFVLEYTVMPENLTLQVVANILTMTRGERHSACSIIQKDSRLAGQPIGAPGWRGVLEGIQSDLDYLRLLFGLNRTASHQCFCHYCDSVQWVSNRSDVNHLNNVESLYTVYGPRESDTQKLEIISVAFF